MRNGLVLREEPVVVSKYTHSHPILLTLGFSTTWMGVVEGCEPIAAGPRGRARCRESTSTMLALRDGRVIGEGDPVLGVD